MKSYLKEIQAEQRTMIIADGGTCHVTIIQKQGHTRIQRPRQRSVTKRHRRLKPKDDSASDHEETKLQIHQTPGNSIAHLVHQNAVQWVIALIRARENLLRRLVPE